MDLTTRKTSGETIYVSMNVMTCDRYVSLYFQLYIVLLFTVITITARALRMHGNEGNLLVGFTQRAEEAEGRNPKKVAYNVGLRCCAPNPTYVADLPERFCLEQPVSDYSTAQLIRPTALQGPHPQTPGHYQPVFFTPPFSMGCLPWIQAWKAPSRWKTFSIPLLNSSGSAWRVRAPLMQ